MVMYGQSGLNTNGQLGDDTLYQRLNIVSIGEVALRTEEMIMQIVINKEKQINTYIDDTFNVYLDKTRNVGELEYTVLDESIVRVDNTGKVSAIGLGETIVRIKDKTNGLETATTIKVIKDQEDTKYEPMVAGGAAFSSALKADGTVWTWGQNNYGQLGHNDAVTTEEPAQVVGKNGIGKLEDIKMIAAGQNHMLALKKDGTVYAWGLNNYGQLGDNSQITKYAPVQVLGEDGIGVLENIVYIAAGQNYSAAINAKGEVYTWGFNTNGQLGDGTSTHKYTPVRVKANLTGILQIACGANHMLALKTDGSVYVWGYNTNGQLSDNTFTKRTIPVKMLETADEFVKDAVAVEASNTNSYVLKADGTVISAGYGANGYLGNGVNDGNVKQQLPVNVLDNETSEPIRNIKAIRAGQNTIYALTKTGNVYAWGLGTSAQIGNNELLTKTKAVNVQNGTGTDKLSEILYLGAGGLHGFAVENNGYLQVWGNNNQKQLGIANLDKSTLPIYIGINASATPSNVRLKIGDTQKIKVSMDSFNLFKAEDDKEREFTYKSLNEAIATVTDKGEITAVSNGITKIVITDVVSGKVTSVDVSVLEEGASATPKIEEGFNHTVALKADGTVWTWGYNAQGQLGLGDNQTRYVPTAVGLSDVIDIAAGRHFSLALKSDGTVWAWGYNSNGQLGQGDTNNRNTPVQVLGVGGTGYLQDVIQITAYEGHFAALLKTGEVVVCGKNGNGDLGDNTATDRYTPVYMVNENGTAPVNNVKKVEIGTSGTAILKNDGSLWVAGYNYYGVSGQGNRSANYRVKQVKSYTGSNTLNNIVDISMTNHMLALAEDGTVWAWGYNNYRQLGDNTTTIRSLPIHVLGEDGEVLENIVSVKAGHSSSFLTAADGTVYAWGYNAQGQLGNNTKTTVTVPKKMLNSDGSGAFTDTMIVSGTGEHTTIAKNDGTVWSVRNK